MVDPWAGSYAMESLTNELYSRAKEIVEEVERQGGMTKSVITGFPKLKIEESATRRQADIDSGREVIVGVNKFRLEKEDELQVRKIDNSKVLASQVAKLQQLRSQRDAQKVKQSLQKLEEVGKKVDCFLRLKKRQGARSSSANLLELAIDCARNLATVGEISDALERVFTRYAAKVQIVEGGMCFGRVAFVSEI